MKQIDTTKKPAFMKWVLALSIVIVLNLFFTFAIRLGYKEPMWEKFCPQKQVQEVIDTQDKCVAQGGQWSDNAYYAKSPESGAPIALPAPTDVTNRKEPTGWCDPNYTCNKSFQTANSLYNRNVFVILIILGVITLISSYFITASQAVSLGLSLGGTISLVIASIRYWSDMDDLVRVIVLAIALVSLIAFGIKKFRD